MSGRTLARRFEAELGMSLRSWRRRLRLFKAIELLGGSLSVTQTAMELGYGSTSAFVYAFRTEMGCGPQAYMRGRSANLSVRTRLPDDRVSGAKPVARVRFALPRCRLV
ncbi:helix-turn-helix domain-containing protein [Siccirubricoccus sp. G192]|uniref:helix-turn-helix domain-containing protein n=1 Tax=Siccirubricoccus sp. G192 TaxID=2849651 RepID=UPI001C2C2815|nr:AraC family transcriptional regulator [Siccirubricoccus sp. G192]MBV1795650.1 AraC family transcriptional regulator [Siccirubricoccus sp. G192]